MMSISAIRVKPVFVKESHGDKIKRLGTRVSKGDSERKSRRARILKLVKDNPCVFNTKMLATKFDVSTVTIGSDIKNINGVRKSTRKGFKSKFVYNAAP